MRLFESRRGPAPDTGRYVTWQPVRGFPRELTGPDADMDDDGQTLQSAYRVDFTLAAQPAARITVCTYAVDCEDAYWKGLRYEYTVWAPGRAVPTFRYVGWEKDPDDEEYPTPAAADAAALELARVLVRDPVWADRVLPNIFDWDGAGWEQ
jgi:hypothetical protein